MKEKLKQYFYLMRFHKPIGILLLLWPTLWALWLASNGKPNVYIVTIFVLGVVVMRAAGCIINDFADRHFDAHVERTRERPLATGKVSVKEALILFSILILCAFLLVLQLNYLTIGLAFGGAAITIIYPFLKRVTHLPQLGLGLAFAWGVPMAFAAQNNTISWQAWILFLAAAIWPVIYDTMYAMADKDDDLKIGIKSTAILFGRYNWLILGLLQLLFWLVLLLVGFLFNMQYAYFVALFAVASLFIYQQSLIIKQTRESSFKAFLNNHWVGFSVFTGIIVSYSL